MPLSWQAPCHQNQLHRTCPQCPTYHRAPAPSCTPSARATNSQQPPSTKVPWKESPPPADLHVKMTHRGKIDSPRLPQGWGPAQRGPAVSLRCEVDPWLHPRRVETVICPHNLPMWPQKAQYLAKSGLMLRVHKCVDFPQRPSAWVQEWCPLPSAQPAHECAYTHIHTHSHTHTVTCSWTEAHMYTLTFIHTCTSRHTHMLMNMFTHQWA